MPTAAILGSGVLGAGASIYASNKQADAQKQALALQQSMYNQGRQDLAPWRNIGTGAINSLGGLYGIHPDGTQGSPFSQNSLDMFTKSPDYQFAFQQGTRATQFGEAARGNLLSGAGAKELTQFGQGLGAQQFGNYFNRLLGLAQMGGQAASGSASNALAAGGQMGQTIGNIGTAQASGVVGAANALGGATNNLMLYSSLR
jgi:hypothetical protein